MQFSRNKAMKAGKVRIILGKNLKLFRGRRAMSQADLAEFAGISIPFLSDIERGNKWPYIETLVSLAEALGIEPYELLRPQKSTSDTDARIITECLDNVLVASKRSFEEAMVKSLKKIRKSYTGRE
jgi:transcriptional regulator with XRE-family HTH domain